MSIEFQIWNISGYLFYTIYNIWGYIVQHNHSKEISNSIKPNDIAFTVHGLLMTAAVCVQVILWRKPGTDKVSWVHVIMIICMWILAVYNFVLAANDYIPYYRISNSPYAYSAVQFLGFCKGFVTIIKYIPQIWLHYTTKSTKGFAIQNIMLDFGGGLFSFLQMMIDSIDTKDWGHFTSNVPKLVIACVSMFYDVVILIQHFVLYRSRTSEFQQLSALDVYLVDDGDVPPVRTHGTSITVNAGHLNGPSSFGHSINSL